MITTLDTDKLVKVLALLSSDQVGERASAGDIAHKMITAAGLTWRDVIPLEVSASPEAKHKREQAQRQQEMAERERKAQRERERQEEAARERDNEEQAKLLAKIADLGWPRVHIKKCRGDIPSQWINGEAAWRAALDRRCARRRYDDDFGHPQGDGWLFDIHNAVRDFAYMQNKARESAAAKTDLQAGIDLIGKCLRDYNTPEMVEKAVHQLLAHEMGLSQKGQATPKGRVKQIVDAALAAGIIERCTIDEWRGPQPGYRLVAR